jgi:hypothetical protein
VIIYQPWKLTSDVNKSQEIGQQPNHFSFFLFHFVIKLRVVCRKVTKLALQEPGVEVDDSRECQLLLHPPLQVVCNLTH